MNSDQTSSGITPDEKDPLFVEIKKNQDSHEHCKYCIKAMSNPDANFCCLCWVRNE